MSTKLSSVLVSRLASSLSSRLSEGLYSSSAPVFSPVDIASCRLCLDASDITTLYQDAVGSTPVTASGQSVKLWRDTTANATLFTESSTAPVYTVAGGLKYLVFNGSTSKLTSAMDLSAINTLTICAAVRRLATVDMTLINQNGSSQPSFLQSVTSTGTLLNATSWGSAGGSARSATQALAAQPKTDIFSSFHRISSPLVQTRLNGVNGTATTTGQGTGNFSNGNVRIGLTTNSVRPWNGNIYALAMFTTILTEEELDSVEAWLAERAGVTL